MTAPFHMKAVAFSTPRYVETVLCGNRVLRVSRYRRAVAISAPHYLTTALFGNSVLRVKHYRRVDCTFKNMYILLTHKHKHTYKRSTHT